MRQIHNGSSSGLIFASDFWRNCEQTLVLHFCMPQSYNIQHDAHKLSQKSIEINLVLIFIPSTYPTEFFTNLFLPWLSVRKSIPFATHLKTNCKEPTKGQICLPAHRTPPGAGNRYTSNAGGLGFFVRLWANCNLPGFNKEKYNPGVTSWRAKEASSFFPFSPTFYPDKMFRRFKKAPYRRPGIKSQLMGTEILEFWGTLELRSCNCPEWPSPMGGRGGDSSPNAPRQRKYGCFHYGAWKKGCSRWGTLVQTCFSVTMQHQEDQRMRDIAPGHGGRRPYKLRVK